MGISFNREHNDDGEEQLVAYLNDDEMVIVARHEEQWYGLVDFGSSDYVGPLMPTALKALYAVRQHVIEGEKWAEQMLADEASGKIEFSHNEAVQRDDGIVEMGGSWKVKSTN